MKFVGRLCLLLLLFSALSGGQAPTSVPKIMDLTENTWVGLKEVQYTITTAT
jgi:hypothetical protein